MDDLMRSLTSSIQSFLGIESQQNLSLKAVQFNVRRVQSDDYSTFSQLGRTREDISYSNLLLKLREEFLERWEKNQLQQASLNDFIRYRTLGAGTFGRVVLMRHKESEKYHAAKILTKERLVKMKQVKHALHEKKILQSICFPFLVNLDYFIMDNSNLYFIMPYMSGGELYAVMKRMSRFDERLAKFYAAQVCLGLEYMHALDLIYRDLKPENILLETSGYVKLIDFGFAKVCTGRTYTLCGTPDYMAPEVILNKGHSKPVDWWSFGVFLYEMCAGQPPFHTETLLEIYHKILKARYRMPQQFSNELKDLVQNLLQLDVTQRYGNLKNGVYDIKKHEWFKDMDFKSLYEQKLDPPYKPLCKSAADSGNFINFKEEPTKIASSDRFESVFKEFL